MKKQSAKNPAQQSAPVRRYAVVDIGSNATRLLVGLVGADGKFFAEVFSRMPLQLGGAAYSYSNSNGGGKRKLDADTVRRLRQTLSGMQLFVRAMSPVAAMRVVATAALRDAANRAAVVASVRRHCGIGVEVLSGREEAEIIGEFVAAQFPAAAVLNIDVGGGSCDCALLEAGRIARVGTFALGTARAGGGAVAEKARFRRWLAPAKKTNPILCGSGGSVRALQEMLGEISAPKLAAARRQLVKMPPLKIAEQYNLSPDRAANVVAAIKIYELALAGAGGGGTIRPVQGGLAEAALRKLAADDAAGAADAGRKLAKR